MENHSEDKIRNRAHEIWEEAGRPNGEHESHWHQAAKELGLASPVEQAPGTAVDVEPHRRRSAQSKSLPIAE